MTPDSLSEAGILESPFGRLNATEEKEVKASLFLARHPDTRLALLRN